MHYLLLVFILLICFVFPVYAEQFGYEGQQMNVSVGTLSPGEILPFRYTCEGEGITPVVSWEGISDKAGSLILILDDPDAPYGTFTHWILSSGNTSRTGILEGEDLTHQENSITEGISSAGNPGYFPPCPPHGQEHRYIFTLYALDIPVNASQADRKKIDAMIEGHILQKASFETKFRSSS